MSRVSYRKMDINKLVQLAQKEDYKALEELIRIVQKDVFATLSYLVDNKNEISDLTQIVLFRFAKNIALLSNPDKFKSWLNRIIYNVYFDDIRRKKRGCFYISIEEDNFSELVDEKSIEPIEKCSAVELDKLVKLAILSLPEYFKISIILREFSGISYKEIAEITNVTIGTVKSRIARARLILQNKLKNCI